MADRIVLDTPLYKGEFDLDVAEQPLTSLEWRWMKKISGYLPLTLGEGLAGGDPDIYIAFAVIALVRAGKIGREQALTAADHLADAPFGSAITFIGEEQQEEEDADPPAMPAEAGQPPRSTGGSSASTSDLPEPTRLRTGALG